MYTKGHSETILGDLLGSKRDRLVLSTKFASNMHPGDPNGGGAGRKAIIRACEESLRRLKTDYIDLYFIHQRDRHTPLDETLSALDALVKSGKVRYLGVSAHRAWQIAQAQLLTQIHHWTPFIGMQLEYSLLARSIEGDLVPMAKEFGIGLLPWSPLKNGVLSGKYTRARTAVDAGRGAFVEPSLDERTFTVVDELQRIANQLSTTPARVALAWVRGRAGVSSIVIGARRLAQLEDNIGSLDIQLPKEAMTALDALTAPEPSFPAPYEAFSSMLQSGGMTINGESWPLSPVSVRPEDHRY